MPELHIHKSVQQALAQRRAVVALETAVTTAGLPRTPLQPPEMNDPHIDTALQQWRADSPTNLETALAMARVVETAGATPAVIAAMNGRLHIGLDDTELEQLARDETAEKCSTADFAAALSRGTCAGTTVSATLAACRLTAPPLRVFATGGIGGVHRNWVKHPDISTDLRALSRTPVCVVCSGAKSLLDLPATVEALETLGIPIIGFGTDYFPQFVAGVRSDLPLRHHCTDVDAIARHMHTHWKLLAQHSAVLVVNPVPDALAADADEMETAVQQAESEATQRAIHGAARTPFVLDHVARNTDGRSLIANIALLLSNAQLAARISSAWSQVDI